MHEKLFTPGPTEVTSDNLQALATPQIHHRTDEFSEVYDDIQGYLQELLYTDNPVFLLSSSSTGAMECAVTNSVKKCCLNLVNGAFGDRWHKITAKNGVPCEKMEIEWDQPLRPEMIDEKLASGDYDAVTMVFNETSTGLMNPLSEIAKIVKQYDDVLLLVDAVSGMAGSKIEVDKLDIDMCLAGVQKAFSLPAGLAVATCSEELLERAEEIEATSYYFNIPLLNKYHKRSQTRVTPAIPQIFALRKQLKQIVEEEGIENRFKRHKDMAELVQEWALKYFDIFPKKGYWSNTVTCIENTREISVKNLIQELVNNYNIRIASGYGDMKEKAFRIGHMGDIGIADIKGLLSIINDILEL